MKRQFFNLIAVSLSASALLMSAPKAFSHTVQAEASVKEAQPLVHNVENPRGTPPEQAKKPAIVQPTTQPTTQPSQPSLLRQTTQVSETSQGLFVICLFSGYILVGVRYRKHCNQRAVTLQQQIEMLERIWKMKSHKKENS